MTRILWVWEDTIPVDWPTGYEQVMVKAFDGKALQSAAGFNWATNYASWRDRFGQHRVIPWGVAYQQDGADLGPAISGTVHGASLVVVDIEDWNSQGWSDAAIHDTVRGIRTSLPGMKVGYSTFPTRKQCLDHGINQLILDQLTDVSFPQAYFPYQLAQLGQVRADHKDPVITVSPADDGGWVSAANAGEQWFGQCAFWRMGVDGWKDWGAQVTNWGPPPPGPAPSADPLRPAAGGAWPQGRFVAWDGKYWSLTDGIWYRPLTEGMAQGLAWDGVPVHLWPHCRVEAAEARQ